MPDESEFAKRSLRAYELYLALSESERVSAFQQILQDLAHTSREQFDFWARKSGVRGDVVHVSAWRIWWLRVMRRMCGISFTARYIVGRKERVIAEYRKYCRTCNPESDVRAVDAFVERLHALTDSLRRI